MRASFLSFSIVWMAALLLGTAQAASSSSLASSGYLCKCTCFSTNTTIVPLSPSSLNFNRPLSDSNNPCNTCTRQFCLSQNLAGCEGARIERPDVDTGTGWEGEVWAKCFQRDGLKDRTIVSLYVVTVIVLLLAAALREHIAIWLEEYRTGGPKALLRSIRDSLPDRSRLPTRLDQGRRR